MTPSQIPFVRGRGAQRRAHRARLIRVRRHDEHTRLTNQDIWINERVYAERARGVPSFSHPRRALVLMVAAVPHRMVVVDNGLSLRNREGEETMRTIRALAIAVPAAAAGAALLLAATTAYANV